MLLLMLFLYLDPHSTPSFYHHLHLAKSNLFFNIHLMCYQLQGSSSWQDICPSSMLLQPAIFFSVTASDMYARPCWLLTHNHCFSRLLAGRICLSQQRLKKPDTRSQPALQLRSGMWSNPAQRGWMGNQLMDSWEKFTSMATKKRDRKSVV